MTRRALLYTGAVGAGVTALCCVTALLPWILSAFGLGALIPLLYRDAVLLPLLAGFILLTGISALRMRR